MSNLAINDLPLNEELDRAATTAILGGIYRSGFGFLLPYSKAQAPSGSFPTGITNITNNFIDVDYNVVQQNPTNFYVNNGAGNSGTIINSFSTMSLTAASPALIQAS
jgi:hypothetical protein